MNRRVRLPDIQLSTMSHRYAATVWHRSPEAWCFVLLRFVPLLAAGNLAWETVQLPFYTIWREGTLQDRLFAIAHCTTGDVVIGTAALVVAVMLFARRGWPRFGHGRVLATATLLGVTYTVFSEWLNTQVTMGWDYAETMIRVPPVGTGIAPLLQWIIVPPVAYSLARALCRARGE